MSDISLKESPRKLTSSVWRKHGLKLLSIGLAFLSLAISLVIHNDAEKALIAAKSSFQQQQNINAEASQSAALLNQYLAPYRSLQEQGLIDQPRRLQWLETLQASVNHNLLPKMNFILSPSAQANATNTSYTSDTLAIKVTPLRVDFVLLHEGDFYRLLQEMKTQSKGLFSAENCEITRNEKEVGESQVKGGFRGYCNLLWYSLADITHAWEVPSAP